jgi:serine acetyltransferase
MSIFAFIIFRIKGLTYFIRDLYICYQNNFPNRLALCCDVDIKNLPKNTIFPHPVGIVIKRDTILGENVTIRQNTTIGMRHRPDESGCTIEDNVDIGANVLILGPVNIGNGARIGAGAIVLKDVPEGRTIVGVWK